MSKALVLSSPANPLLKDVRKALHRGTLTDDGYCVAEGRRLLEEARRSGSKIHVILAAASLEARFMDSVDEVILVEDRVFESIAGTETTQGVIALIERPSWKIGQLFRRDSLVVVLDAIQDPGNAGTIARAAEAFGATGVLFLKGGVNPFNAKVLRSSAGSLFRIPFVNGMDAAEALAILRQERIDLYASVPCAGCASASQTDFTGPCAIVVGNEGSGVSERFRSVAHPVTIPTTGVESLNAAMAAGILLYEARRQRAARA